MKLKKELNRIKELPITVQIVYGIVLFIGVIIKMILKVVFSLFYFLYKRIERVNNKKVKPLINSLNEYLYSRACEVFGCGAEQGGGSLTQDEVERTLPWISKIGNVFSRLLSLIFGKKLKVVKSNLARKNGFKNPKKAPEKSKTVVTTFLSKFQALFKVLDF